MDPGRRRSFVSVLRVVFAARVRVLWTDQGRKMEIRSPDYPGHHHRGVHPPANNIETDLMFIELAKHRQSCRSYLPKSVPRQIILDCLEAARLAPSACNSQPWHFIIVDEPAMKDALCQASLSGLYAMNYFAKEAPVIIAVVTERAPFLTRVVGSLRRTPYWLIDIGIAVEHFVLQAAESGLATCWIGWFDEKQAAKILRVPHTKRIVCLISLGYSEETLREKNRKSAQEIYSFNQYNATNTKLHNKEGICQRPS